jgi:hypothetical protein
MPGSRWFSSIASASDTTIDPGMNMAAYASVLTSETTSRRSWNICR